MFTWIFTDIFGQHAWHFIIRGVGGSCFLSLWLDAGKSQRVGYTALHWCYACCCVDLDISISSAAAAAAAASRQHPTNCIVQRDPADEAPPGAWTVQHNGRGFGGCLSVVHQQQVAWIIPTQPSCIISFWGMIRAPLSAWCGRRAVRERGFLSWLSTERKTAWSRCVHDDGLPHMHK